jgi:hypothetical protein
MRQTCRPGDTPRVTKQRVILDGAIEGSVIRGTLTAPTGERREFHGWLELNTALEAMLDTGAVGAPTTSASAPTVTDERSIDALESD